MSDSESLVTANDLGRFPVSATRLRCGAGQVAGASLSSEAAVIVLVHPRELASPQHSLQSRPQSATRTLAAGTVQVIDLRSNPDWRLEGPLDCLHLHVPHAALQRLAAEQGCELAPFVPIQTDDVVLEHLGACFLEAMSHPKETSRTYIEHIALALHTHLARTYYRLPLPTSQSQPRGLATSQQRIAMEAMLDDIGRGFEVADVAMRCSMSVARFRRAFRGHTGQTPYRWLTRRRIESALDLLKIRSLPLAEIALRCGFSDQSHFTRVFAQLTGSTPGAWRRASC